MAKDTSERGRNGKRPEPLPRTPPSSAANAKDGMEIARESACYLPDCVDTCAAIALSPASECGLYTRYLAGHELSSIAGAIPQALPAPLLQPRRTGRTCF